MISLLADETTPCEAKCRRCHRPLSEAESLGYSIGPVCRKRLGIEGRRRLRLARGRSWDQIDGQGDLLTEPEED